MKKYSKPSLKVEKSVKTYNFLACRCSGVSTHRM